MQCLVTGGGGFIGSHVVRSLLNRDHTVRVLHVPDEDLRNLEDVQEELELIKGDIRDRDCMLECVENCDLVFHLAALYRIWMPDPAIIYSVNVDGTRTVMEAAQQEGVDRVVYTSTMGIYQTKSNQNITEESPHRSENHEDDYIASKVRAHHLVDDYVEQDMDVVSVAPTLPIGPGDIGPTPTGRILLAAVKNPIALVFDQLANIGDVRDIAEGHVLAAEQGDPGEVYLLGNQNVNMTDLAKKVQEITGINRTTLNPPIWVAKGLAWAMESYAEYISGEPPQFTPAAIEVASRGFQVDCSKAKNELGLPSRSLEESIKDSVKWFHEQRMLDLGSLETDR